ncbi:hypothetical protein TNCV_2387071 [Trichonephila clavipes]|nr:hypothetical protein TNCV_2387071 [Trichonephila clavipes]
MLNVELVQRENANLEVMDLPLNIQKIAAQHLPTPVLQKLKIPPAFDEEIAEYQRKPLTGNRIIDMEVLLNLFLQLCCPRCFEEGILLSEDSTYGKLTDSFTDRLQNYYGIAVRSNVEKPIRSSAKMLLRLCFIAHQVSRNRCMGSVPSEKIVGATTSEHCLVAKSQTKNIKAYQMKY